MRIQLDSVNNQFFVCSGALVLCEEANWLDALEYAENYARYIQGESDLLPAIHLTERAMTAIVGER